MKRIVLRVFLVCILVIGLLLTSIGAAAQTQQILTTTSIYTTISFEGQLEENGQPLSGSYNMRFELFDAESSGNLIGSEKISKVSVVDGTYNVELKYETPLTDQSYWLEVAIKSGGGYSVLPGRYEVLVDQTGLFEMWLSFLGVLPANLIKSSHIADGEIIAADIADGTMTLEKINTAGANAGDVPIYDGTILKWGKAESYLPEPIMGFAYIQEDGTVLSGSGNIYSSLGENSYGYAYEIVLENEAYIPGKHLIFITPMEHVVSKIQSTPNGFSVIFIDLFELDTNSSQSDFQIVIYRTDDDVVNPYQYYYMDWDDDGYGDPTRYTWTSGPDEFFKVTNGDDFNDHDATCYPGAPELPDGKDNDGDGQIDEGLDVGIYYMDMDGDGYGYTQEGAYSHEASEFIIVEEPYDPEPPYTATEFGDWYDEDPNSYPGAPEIADNVDNNYNGEVDEGLPTQMYYYDEDGDGYGIDDNYLTLAAPLDYYRATVGGDFNDLDASCYPGAPEILDAKDNDGDGEIDEGLAEAFYYLDNDGDGYGATDYGYYGHEFSDYMIYDVGLAEAPYTATQYGDWLDWDWNSYPGAPELPDGIDNDFDGSVDEDIVYYIFYLDIDGDGYGVDYDTQEYPIPVYPYTATQGGDFDDSNPASYPGAPEILDGKDNDGDGLIDEGLTP